MSNPSGTSSNSRSSLAHVGTLVQSTFLSASSIVPKSRAEKQSVEGSPQLEGGHPIKTDRRQRISQTKLNFLSKSSAGSASSAQQAHIPIKQNSIDSVTSPMSSNQHSLHTQGSSSSLASIENHQEEDFPVPKSSTLSGLIPRHPTGSDWSYSLSHDSDSVPLHDILIDLDRKARDTGTASRARVMSLNRPSIVYQPVSWEENAASNSHMWHELDTREACYLAETQFCQQFKTKRNKHRCAACKVVAHSTCIQQLAYEGVTCKYTFREIRQKVKDNVMVHHFLNRRKVYGKCVTCNRGFGNWKKFSGRDLIGISCSWCGDSYHVCCFDENLRREQCTFGPLRNLIIPPSWIVKTPIIEQVSASAGNDPTSPKSTRRKSRRSRRKKPEERVSKHFAVKSVVSQHNKPLLIFINPKSGGNQGAKTLEIFQWLLNPRQVFDLSQGGPKFGLQFFRNMSNLRVMACGGDGTAGWVLSILDDLDIRPSPPLAILPLGTGNDLARVLKWGGSYTDEPIDKILMHVEEGPVVKLDRWHLSVWPNPRLPANQMVDSDAVGDVPLHVINNYFSVGADAHAALEFHLERQANPEKFNSRLKNRFFYSKLGGKDIFVRRFHNMTEDIKLWGDGIELTEKIRALRLESICLLNIPSHGGGTNPWGTPSGRDSKIGPQAIDDKQIEIVGFWSHTLAKLQVGLAHGERIAQCEHVKMETYKALPVQVDGEACKLLPSVIEVGLKNQVPMITKIARRDIDTPLRGVNSYDRIKLSVSKVTTIQYDRLHSDVYEIKKISKPIGMIVTTAQDSLKTIRSQINLFTTELDEDGDIQLSKKWRFLDVASTARFVDRMFQILPDQEEATFVSDMLSDGLLVVELDDSPETTPECTPKIILSPQTDYTPLGTADDRRKVFGRNSSYELATSEQRLNSSSPPKQTPVNEHMSSAPPEPLTNTVNEHTSSAPPEPLTNTVNEHTSSAPPGPLTNTVQCSSSDATPIGSDEDTPSAYLPHLVDTDSGETDVYADGPASIQKALLDSAKRGNLSLVREYHTRGAKLTATDSNSWTPLHHAARLGKKEVVQYIVDNITKTSIDIVEEERIQTALHKAAWYGYLDICIALVEAGASLTRTDYQGSTPYDRAVQNGDPALKQYLKRKETEMKLMSTELNEVAI